MITAGVRFHAAGIDREGFTLDQTGVHARPHHRLEYLAEQVAIAEPAVTIDRERRVIGHIVVEVEPAEPPVGQMQFDFLAQLPLKTDAVAVADDQHPDHQLGINRGPANAAIKGRQLIAKLNQYPRHHRIDPAQKMARWNAPFEVEQVKQLALIARLSTHHGKPPPPNPSSRRNHCSPISATPFSTVSTHSVTSPPSIAAPRKDYSITSSAQPRVQV